jgi:hypothetical protein
MRGKIQPFLDSVRWYLYSAGPSIFPIVAHTQVIVAGAMDVVAGAFLSVQDDI